MTKQSKNTCVFQIIALIIVFIILSCSLDPYGEGLGENSTGRGDYVSCKPSAPADVWQSRKFSDTIIILWSAVEDALSYNVYLNGRLFFNTRGTGMAVGNLQPSLTHRYIIKSVNDCGESINSIFFEACTTPPIPTNVFASRRSDERTDISWTNSWRAQSFNIYRSEHPIWRFSLIGSVRGNESFFTDTTFDASKNYFYRITAVSSCGESQWSSYTDCVIPSVPTGVRAEATSTSSGTVRISWNRVEGASSYKIYWATSATGIFSQLSPNTIITTTSVFAHFPSPETRYFKVSAVSCYESEMSEIVSTTIEGE